MNEETITMKQKAEFRASGLLLDLGISIPVRPLRFMTKKKRCGITMRTPALGGLIRISRKYCNWGYQSMKCRIIRLTRTWSL